MSKNTLQQAFSTIYLAGRITSADWRHDLVPGLHDAEQIGDDERTKLHIGRWRYTGPFFVSCGHGCAHGPGSHGRGLTVSGCFEEGEDDCVPPDVRQREVAKTCISGIDECSFVFCWLEDHEAFGTLFELGYAKARDKQIFIALKKTETAQNLSSDIWLALSQSQMWILADNHQVAWQAFEEWVARREWIAKLRKPTKPATKSQMLRLYDLIDECRDIEVIDDDMLDEVDSVTADAIIRCLETGGTVARDFPELFANNTDDFDDANSDEPIAPEYFPKDLRD
jgi:hypothetical protein